MPVTEGSPWADAIASRRGERIEPLLADGVELTVAGRWVTGRRPVALALADSLGPADPDARVTELGHAGLLAVSPAEAAGRCVLVRARFDDTARVVAVELHEVPGAADRPGVSAGNRLPATVLGAESRTLAAGISVRSFAATRRVTKRWGNETWLHGEGHPFGFKVIRLDAGRRTSLQYHEKKDEVYFVLEGVARLHYRTDEGAIATVPFVGGTVATVAPMAWHRVEAVTDVIMIEASTYDDGSDNIRVEDDYGRGNGYIAAEFGDGAP